MKRKRQMPIRWFFNGCIIILSMVMSLSGCSGRKDQREVKEELAVDAETPSQDKNINSLLTTHDMQTENLWVASENNIDSPVAVTPEDKKRILAILDQAVYNKHLNESGIQLKMVEPPFTLFVGDKESYENCIMV